LLHIDCNNAAIIHHHDKTLGKAKIQQSKKRSWEIKQRGTRVRAAPHSGSTNQSYSMADPCQEIRLPHKDTYLSNNSDTTSGQQCGDRRPALLSSHALYDPITRTLQGLDLSSNTPRWSKTLKELFGDEIDDDDDDNFDIDRLASNSTGTVHAVATSVGTVSLLDDSNNGRIIITRRVRPENHSPLSQPKDSSENNNDALTFPTTIDIDFVQYGAAEGCDAGDDNISSSSSNNKNNESLIVVIPPIGDDASQKQTVILVHNIPSKPEDLHSPSHLSQIRVLPLVFDLTTTTTVNATKEGSAAQEQDKRQDITRSKQPAAPPRIAQIKSCFLNKGTVTGIRFAVLSSESTLSIHDFSTTTNQVALVSSDVLLSTTAESDNDNHNLEHDSGDALTVDRRVGLVLDTFSPHGPILAILRHATRDDEEGRQGSRDSSDILHSIHMPTLSFMGTISNLQDLLRQASHRSNEKRRSNTMPSPSAAEQHHIQHMIPVASARISDKYLTTALAVTYQTTQADNKPSVMSTCIIQSVLVPLQKGLEQATAAMRENDTVSPCSVTQPHILFNSRIEQHGRDNIEGTFIKSSAISAWPKTLYSFALCAMNQSPPKEDSTSSRRQRKVLKTQSPSDVHTPSPTKNSNPPGTTHMYLQCLSFHSSSNASEMEQIGQFHGLVALGEFEEATSVCFKVAAASRTEKGELSLHRAGCIHPSYVALGQFSSLLEQMISNFRLVSEQDVLSSLGQLKTGAIAAASDVGILCLIEAGFRVSQWASSPATYAKHLPLKVPRRGIQTAVPFFQETCAVIGSSKSAHAASLRQTRKALEHQLMTMRALEKTSIHFRWSSEKIRSFVAHTSSIPDLFQAMVAKGNFGYADYIQCMAQEYIHVNILLHALLGLPTLGGELVALDLRKVLVWVQDIIVPRVNGVHDSRWTHLLEWSRRLAHTLDECDQGMDREDDKGLNEAILLLETMCHTSSQLSARPFLLASSAGQSRDISKETARGISGYHNISAVNPNPTVLDTHMLRSIKQSNNTRGFETSGDNEELDATQMIRRELEHALAIRDARKLGLPRRLCSLQTFQGAHFLATELLRCLLAGSNMTPSKDNIASVVSAQVTPYCKHHNVDFDKVVLFYVEERLDDCVGAFKESEDEDEHESSSVSPTAEGDDTLTLLASVSRGNRPCFKILLEISYLCACTTSLLTKSKLVLQLLRTAMMLSGEMTSVKLATFDLESQARGMIAACHIQQQPQTASELEEALRLLQIDHILCHYCGRESRDWFHVADAEHGKALIRHVARFIDEPAVIDHIWVLCSAFMNCDKVSIFADVLERTMLTQCDDKIGNVIKLLKDVLGHDDELGQIVALHTIRFGMRLINQYCNALQNSDDSITKEMQKNNQTKAEIACASSLKIAALMKEVCRQNKRRQPDAASSKEATFNAWNEKWQDLSRLKRLQTRHRVFISISSLQQEAEVDFTLAKLLQPVLNLVATPSGKRENTTANWSRKAQELFAIARQACSTLCRTHNSSCRSWWRAISQTACRLIETTSDDACVYDFLLASGILEEDAAAISALSTENTSSAIACVAESLMHRASDLVRNTNSCNGYASDTEQFLVSDRDASVEKLLRPMKFVIRASMLAEHFCLLHASDTKLSKTVSLANSIDLVSQVLLRSDKGVGEALEQKRQELWQDSFLMRHVSALGETNEKSSTPRPQPLLPCRKIHPTWYVGDGLLLPPDKCLSLSLRQWVYHQSTTSSNAKHSIKGFHIKGDMLRLLNERGAHNLAMRILASSASEVVSLTNSDLHQSVLAARQSAKKQVEALFAGTNKFLAERSLGGSGTGFTSGVVDSHLAVGYLFMLPLKVGFKVRSHSNNTETT
jgi:hypothetical protein